ncbi:DUF2493 domain-containing protein [Singulisphaera acidiphila]|uniref:YspA cpYpsA-related SLOG domain-containing protein n=1 Tax=Singulisphaera acidiphila (strain ATCC BAA-1392 / DSM 18658 / VKM B-2454 / MOB10) TaxID=886293 RepID=L0DPD7_SINAD|nr:DUF2493 domain-containing protein [Singulisphaera acidiphila]AGA30703.1 Protein of unknown function (DUF2493) [Singulisphaera acidiphila DSM 18658]
MPIRVLITGDREWACLGIAEAVVTRLVARYGPGVVIVHGGAKGVDLSFELAAREQELATEVHEADWEKHGRKAGPLSSQEMVDLGAELAIVVHRNLVGSRVTKDCVRRCLEAGIPVWLIDSEEVKPRQVTKL